MTKIRKCSSQFVETAIDEERVLLKLADGEFFSLKGTGLAIWDALDETPDKCDLIELLCTEFDGPPTALTKDIEAFLGELIDAGFAETSED